MTVSTAMSTAVPEVPLPPASPALAEADVLALIHDWFAVLNSPGQAEDLLALLVERGLVVRRPEGTLRSHAEVREWWADFRENSPALPRVPGDIAVRITSPMHAEVTLTVSRGTRRETREHWSLFAHDGVARIRTCAVYLHEDAR